MGRAIEAGTVLIIDDDPEFGARAVRVLERAGIATRYHRGPFGSLVAVREAGCEVVLLDVNMPRLDGSVLLRMIHGTFGAGKIRVLLCSDMAADRLTQLAARLGAQGAVPKEIIADDRCHELREAIGFD
ncbi:response regulator [Polyangium aurulentum]|uniref:response regulator n=1 Tax=Polyangium aurulentum TaxID=2567896 RepID=UPI0010AE450E|nr:response regulator [Polyangium aurulentum]UQA59433.1 response regulator [Polyangium aurulentum]